MSALFDTKSDISLKFVPEFCLYSYVSLSLSYSVCSISV